MSRGCQSRAHEQTYLAIRDSVRQTLNMHRSPTANSKGDLMRKVAILGISVAMSLAVASETDAGFARLMRGRLLTRATCVKSVSRKGNETKLKHKGVAKDKVVREKAPAPPGSTTVKPTDDESGAN